MFLRGCMLSLRFKVTAIATALASIDFQAGKNVSSEQRNTKALF